jgi:hypothetical protein
MIVAMLALFVAGQWAARDHLPDHRSSKSNGPVTEPTPRLSGRPRPRGSAASARRRRAWGAAPGRRCRESGLTRTQARRGRVCRTHFRRERSTLGELNLTRDGTSCTPRIQTLPAGCVRSSHGSVGRTPLCSGDQVRANRDVSTVHRRQSLWERSRWFRLRRRVDPMRGPTGLAPLVQLPGRDQRRVGCQRPGSARFCLWQTRHRQTRLIRSRGRAPGLIFREFCRLRPAAAALSVARG